MKKKLVGILATIACLACFTSCSVDGVVDTVKGAVGNVKDKITSLIGGEEEKKPSENLEKAQSYLSSIYKAGDNTDTVADFNVMGNVPATVGGYAVTWTADNEAVQIVKNENGSYTVKIVNKEPKEVISYKLTAKIVDENGFEAVCVFTRKIPAVKYTQAEIVDMAYALEKGARLDEVVTLTGVITHITESYNPNYSNVTVIMAVPGKEDKPIMCYHMKGTGADVVKVGDTITVSGDITNYSGKIEFSNADTNSCDMISYTAGEAAAVELPAADSVLTIEQVLALGLNSSTTEKYYVTGTIKEVYNAQYGNMYLVDEKGNQITVYGTYSADGSVRYDALEVKPEAGDTVTVYGILSLNAKTCLDIETQFKNAWITNHVDNTPDEGGEGDAPLYSTPEEIVNAAYELGINESLAEDVTLTGVITEVGSAYSEKYGNVTVTIVVENMTDKPIVCFRMKGEGADAIKVGDIITVSGSIINFAYDANATSGTVEFNSGCTLDAYTTPTKIVEAAYALGVNESLENKVTLTGVITEVGSAYSEKYGNVTVTIVVDGLTDKPIVCFRLKGEGADVIKVNDTVTVYGSIINYAYDANATSGTVEFNSGCVIVSYEAYVAPVEGETVYDYALQSDPAGTQYTDESKVLDENVTISTHNSGCHFHANNLRIYQSSTNDGWAIITSKKVISSFSMAIADKADTVAVYASVDGTNWVLIENVVTAKNTTSTVALDKTAGYKYVKIDPTTAQTRINSISLTLVG